MPAQKCSSRRRSRCGEGRAAGAPGGSHPGRQGYGGGVLAPDGTIWTVASSSRKDTGPATRQIESIVLQLGVTDVAASKQFYLDHGLTVTKSYGIRYVELDTGPIK